MRWLLTVLAALCVTLGAGTARADVPRSADGYGVMAGSADAPVQLEIFIEPQCPHVAELESSYGQQIADNVDSGRLAVTYRPLTFLDDRHHNDASARIGNALFLAAGPATSPTAYQSFVQDIYRQQSKDGPDDNDIAAMARESGVPEPAAAAIAAGDDAVDPAAMNDANRARLNEENPENPGTPTVYDLDARNVVDLQDPGWLDKLLG
ncbi:MAG: thioredoxin domain-containing protein [Mycobacterium sp.]